MAKKKPLKDYFALGNISASLVLKNLPFVLFLSFLMLIYIANAHYSEKKVRAIQSLQKDVRKLRWHYMALQAELMYNSKRSEVTKIVAPLNLEVPKGTPKKIIVSRDGRYQE
ncbi:MAG: FtsL-like putative cell division protein [Bacteroidota bacterium]